MAVSLTEELKSPKAMFEYYVLLSSSSPQKSHTNKVWSYYLFFLPLLSAPITVSTSALPRWFTPGDQRWMSLLWHNETKCLDREKLWPPSEGKERGRDRKGEVMSGADFHIREVLKWGRCYNILGICWNCFFFFFLKYTMKKHNNTTSKHAPFLDSFFSSSEKSPATGNPPTAYCKYK